MNLFEKEQGAEHLTISQELLNIFEAVRATGKMRSLVQFQSNYKFYLMACHEVASRKLGQVAANFDKLSFEEANPVFTNYCNRRFARSLNERELNEFMDVARFIFGVKKTSEVQPMPTRY